MKATIVTCALTGSAPTKRDNPALPVTPEEIAHAAVEAAAAGAAIVHVHVRDPVTGKVSSDLGLYEEVVGRIRDENDEVLINLTGGPGGRIEIGEDDPRQLGPGSTLMRPEQRFAHIARIRPDICSVDFHTMCSRGSVVVNTPGHLRAIADIVNAAGVKPELEVFDSGNIVLARDLIAEGCFKPPFLFQIVLGVRYGAPASAAALEFLRGLLPPGCEWSAIGVGRMQFPMVAMSYMNGGHVRVGLEDNLYVEKGRLAASNAELVEKAVRIVRDLGGTIASPAEARTILGLPQRGA